MKYSVGKRVKVNFYGTMMIGMNMGYFDGSYVINFYSAGRKSLEEKQIMEVIK